MYLSFYETHYIKKKHTFKKSSSIVLYIYKYKNLTIFYNVSITNPLIKIAITFEPTKLSVKLSHF